MTAAESWSWLATVICGLVGAAAAEPILRGVDAANQWLVRDLTTRAVELDFPLQSLRWMMRCWWIGFFLIILILGAWLRMPPIAIVLALFWLSLPRTVTSFLIERKRVQIRDQMVIGARLMASQYRAGVSDIEALRALARDLPAPLGRLFGQCVQECDRGQSLIDVLTRFKQRLKIDVTSIFVIVLLTCKHTGGKVAEAMTAISRSLEEIQRIERKRESETSSGRTEVLVLAVFPIVMAAIVWLIDAASVERLFSMTIGQIVIAVVMVLSYIAIRWANWLISALR